jgi:hypothetical protein
MAKKKQGSTVHPFTYSAVNSLRATSKPIRQMITELIDNSDDASASEVQVIIMPSEGKHVKSVIVSDNGCGMTFEQLQQSYGIGEITRTRRSTDHGRFGTGGTLYCLTHFDKKQTITRCNGEMSVREYDMEVVKSIDEYQSTHLDFNDEHQALWNSFSISPDQDGTIIILAEPWGGNRGFTSCVVKTKTRLGMKYEDILARGNMKIFVNGDNIDPICPTLHNHPDAKVQIIPISLDGKVVCEAMVSTLYDVPSGDMAMGKTAGAEKKDFVMDQMSGIWVARQDVLITEKPIWFGEGGLQSSGKISSKGAYDRRTRILLKFTSEFDGLFGISNGKDGVQIDQSLSDKIADELRGPISANRQTANLSRKVTKKKQEALGKELSQMSAKRHVRPKKGPGSNPGRKYEMTGKYAGQQSEPFVKDFALDRLGVTNTLFNINTEGVLRINEDHKFYQEELRACTEETLSVMSKFLLCLESTRIELAYAGAENVDEQTVTEFWGVLDKKLRNVS